MKRVAIIVQQGIPKGGCANITAILMGQIALLHPPLYDSEPIKGDAGIQHAAIKQNVVVLRASREQLECFAKVPMEDIDTVVFTELGRQLKNSYDEYRISLQCTTLEDVQLVGVAMIGQDEAIRTHTKKLKLL